MFGGLVERFLKKNHAPEWFANDVKNNLPENEIKEKIKIELQKEVVSRGYDPALWTDDFITRMANVYYGFFDQLYMESA